MKTLVLTTSYPLAPGAISGSFVRDLLVGLAARGGWFEVVTPALAGAPVAPEKPGITVHPAPYPLAAWRGGLAHRHGLPETLAAEPWKWALVPGMLYAMRAAAERRLARGGFGQVWSHWLFPSGVIGAELARRHRLPHLVTAHGADVHQLERIARAPGAGALLGACWSRSALSAPAATTARRLEHVLRDRRVHVCPLPAASGTPRPRAASGGGAHALRLLYLGRFEPIKGPDLLLEACARVAPPALARMTFAGAGSLEARLRDRARTLPHTVSFAGVLEGEAKRRAFEEADLLVLPSRCMPGGRGEGLPHAAMEALAAGTPVLAPEGGALGELIVRTGAGACYAAADDPERIEGIGRTIAALAARPEWLAALAARAERAGRAFAAPVALDAWEAFLYAASEGGA